MQADVPTRVSSTEREKRADATAGVTPRRLRWCMRVQVMSTDAKLVAPAAWTCRPLRRSTCSCGHFVSVTASFCTAVAPIGIRRLAWEGCATAQHTRAEGEDKV